MPGPHRAGHVTGDGTITTGPGVLHAVHLVGGSTAATLILYDNTAASGTILCQLGAIIGGGDGYEPPGGIAFSKGLHADIGGTGAAADVAYDGGN